VGSEGRQGPWAFTRWMPGRVTQLTSTQSGFSDISADDHGYYFLHSTIGPGAQIDIAFYSLQVWGANPSSARSSYDRIGRMLRHLLDDGASDIWRVPTNGGSGALPSSGCCGWDQDHGARSRQQLPLLDGRRWMDWTNCEILASPPPQTTEFPNNSYQARWSLASRPALQGGSQSRELARRCRPPDAVCPHTWQRVKRRADCAQVDLPLGQRSFQRPSIAPHIEASRECWRPPPEQGLSEVLSRTRAAATIVARHARTASVAMTQPPCRVRLWMKPSPLLQVRCALTIARSGRATRR